jgi:predicted permease
MLGDVSIPLLLFSLGVRLTDSRHADWKISVDRRHHHAVAGMALVALAVPLLGLSGRDAGDAAPFRRTAAGGAELRVSPSATGRNPSVWRRSC